MKLCTRYACSDFHQTKILIVKLVHLICDTVVVIIQMRKENTMHNIYLFLMEHLKTFVTTQHQKKIINKAIVMNLNQMLLNLIINIIAIIVFDELMPESSSMNI